MRHIRVLWLIGSLVLAASPLRAAHEPPAPPAGAAAVDYLTAVKPIFAERCYSCHGALKQKAGLRLDAGQLIRKGSDDGPVVVPGKPNDSPLIDSVTGGTTPSGCRRRGRR